MDDEFRVMAVATYGMAYDDEVWQAGHAFKPDAIIGQGNTSDGGPNYLGIDTPYSGQLSIDRDLENIVSNARAMDVPFVLSMGAPGGSDQALERCLAPLDGICQKRSLKLNVGVIKGGIDKTFLREKIRAGVRIASFEGESHLPAVLTERDVDQAHTVVAQMGPEPIMRSLESGVDGVITGRALDVGLFMAPALMRGFDKGLAAHMAKLLECGGLVTEPQTLDPVSGILRADHFVVKPLRQGVRCTCKTAISHAFYERSNPFFEANPGGVLDLTQSRYEQLDDCSVKVSGSRWLERPYELKLEGIRQIGYRYAAIAGIRDPALIRNLDWFLDAAHAHVSAKLGLAAEDGWSLNFRAYGRDGVLGEAEPFRDRQPHEVGLLIDSVAPTERLAGAISTAAVDFTLHMDYPDRIGTAGNLAIPLSPRDFPLGPVFEYSIWHLLPLDDPCEPFTIDVRSYG